MCCGPELFDPKTKKCCHDPYTGNFTITDNTGHIGCCRHIPYDITKEHCFNKNRVLPLHQAMCGKQQYDSRSHTCCNHRTLHSITNISRNGQYCCGDQLYNTRVHQCCQSASGHFLAPKSASCCGTGKILLLTKILGKSRGLSCIKRNLMNQGGHFLSILVGKYFLFNSCQVIFTFCFHK